MALDRSKFKSTVVANIVEQDKELANSLGRDGGNYAKYIKLENGDNLLRIYPPHPEEDGGGDAFAEPKVTVFLPLMVPELDNSGQVILENGRPKLKESVRSVFNARIHGGLPKDLVEEYSRISLEVLEEDLKHCQDAVEKAKIQEKIHKVRGNFALKHNGLGYRSAWAMYVDRIVGNSATFGTIEIGVAVKEGINKVAASTDSGNNPLATDPFTDLDTGRAVLVKYNKDAKKASDFYSVSLDNVTINETHAGRTFPVPRMFPLSDEKLEAFMKVTPLAKRFKNCFKRMDWDLQMEGLAFFDQKNGIGTFQNAEFISICEELDLLVPEDEEQPAEEGAAPITADTTVTEQAEEDNADQFDLMSRAELVTWHKDNQTGVLAKPTMTDDDLRDLARNVTAQYENQDQAEEAVEEQVAEEPQQSEADSIETTQTTVPQTTVSAKDRIAAMRNKTGA